MKRWIIAALALSVLLCVAACDRTSDTPETPATTEAPVTEAPTEEPATEEVTTEAPTAEETTAEEVTTEEETTEAKEEIYHPTLEEVGQYSVSVLYTS